MAASPLSPVLPPLLTFPHPMSTLPYHYGLLYYA